MRFFLAGIMQGSHLAAVIHNQDYRQCVKQLLATHFPGAMVYDPLADHQDSLAYDDERGRSVFFHHNKLCAEIDVLLAFVPEASMGTAIEMWQAFCAGKTVITVSPLVHNWTIKFLSHEVYRDLDEFEAALTGGQLAARIAELAASRLG